MTEAEREMRMARLLQVRTQWAFSECLRLVRTETPVAIEAMVAKAPASKAALR